ncbi:MAG: tyrosine--tRNA ligase [Patescibacteria group bacterium]
MTDREKIEELLTRGVAEVIHKDVLRAKLLEGKPLRIKFGIDPTSPNIHIGRAIPLWKLRAFQDLGHTIVAIIGDFTGVIGDTSDKESERPILSEEIIKQNLATYFEQMGKILDMSKVEKHHNTEWLEKLGYREIGEHADVFSLSDFISRENIKKRLDAGKRISLRELLYPLMQGYDSVAVSADVEVGGTDQKFNILAGRRLQEHFKKEPQNILLVDLIEGLDGRKMSSSWGNTINLTDTANDMFGKVMSLRDEFIVKYFMHVTHVSVERVDEAAAALGRGENPRDIKLDLAEEIVALYHGRDEAVKAREAFIATFQKKEIPEDIIEINSVDHETFMEVLIRAGLVSSKTECRRLFEEGAIKKLSEGGEERITDLDMETFKGVYKIGKRRFLKIN